MTVLSADEIQAQAQERRSRSHARLAMYAKSRAAYFGEHGVPPALQASDAQGRPLMRLQNMRSDLLRRGGAPNMLMPIVDDFVALKGAIPTMKVLPEDDTEEARDKAAKFSRVLRTQWTQSAMDVQSYKSAWYLSALGDVLWTLTPLFPSQATPLRPPGIYITVVDPSTAFPRFKTGWEAEELADVIICERIQSDRAAAQWNIDPTDEEVEVIHYISEDVNCILCEGRIVEAVRHDLGYCPAQWMKNKMNGRPAQSDIFYVIEAHEELQTMILVMNDAIIESTYSQLVIKDPVNVTERFEVGPGAEPIVVQATGGVSRIEPAHQPQSAFMLVEHATSLIQQMAGTAPVRIQNAIPGSNISGRSVHAQQGPMESRLAAFQTALGYHYQRLNQKILHMLWALPEFRDTEMNIYGTEKGKPFSLQFRGAELEGWTRNQILWSAMIGSTAHERAVVGLQLKGQNLVPDEWVLDQMGIDDSEMLVAQARQEAIAKAQPQLAAPPPGEPLPAEQQYQALDKGATPGGESPFAPKPQAVSVQPQAEPPQFTLSGFPPVDTSPTQLAYGTPAPVPDENKLINELLTSIQSQLRGEITSITPFPGGLRIGVTAREDKGLIRATLSPTFGRITFVMEEGHAR